MHLVRQYSQPGYEPLPYVTAQGIGQKEQRKARTDEEQREESGERKPSPSDSLKGNSPLMPLEDRGQSGKDGKVLLAERLGEG